MEALSISRATSSITIDGRLDDPAWLDALEVPLLYEWTPGDNVPPPVETEFLLAYDNRYLYVGVRAHDPEPEAIRAHLMDRDAVTTLVQDDHVLLMVDTFNDERRGFQFRVNPLGVQADAIFSELEGIEDFSWDVIWESKGTITDEGYEVEIALPLDQLRFPRHKADMTWGFDLGRSYPRSRRHRIASTPRSRDSSCLLCQLHKVSGFSGLERSRNIELTPTLTVDRDDERVDFPDGELVEGDEEASVGLSARWGVTPTTTVNATINPDFSQVEADTAQLQVNNRFALFFPEKRPFFLEGIDFFSTLTRAVFTRTVADPKWGVKLTSKQGANALGVFVTEDEFTNLLIPSNQGSTSGRFEANSLAGVVRYRRDIGRGSTIGALVTAREADDYHNYVGGIDSFIRFSPVDTLQLQYLVSETDYPDFVSAGLGQPFESFSGSSFQADYRHTARNWQWSAQYRDLAPDFRADSGFVPRVDLRRGDLLLRRRFWGTESDWYTTFDVSVRSFRTEDRSGQLTNEGNGLTLTYAGPLQSRVFVRYERLQELFRNTLYEGIDRFNVELSLQPSGALQLDLDTRFGETVDLANNRLADEVLVQPAIEAKLGQHLNIRLRHSLQHLDIDGERLFEANLTQLRLVYNFNVRLLARLITQYAQVERNQDLFLTDVADSSEDLLSEILLSYKVNARTLLFFGYRESRQGFDQVDLTQSFRTIFIKLGYAWNL